MIRSAQSLSKNLRHGMTLILPGNELGIVPNSSNLDIPYFQRKMPGDPAKIRIVVDTGSLQQKSG